MSGTRKSTKKGVKNTKIIEKNNEQKKNRIYNVIVLIFALCGGICLLCLMFNKTFFREKYINNLFQLDIPMFTYFVSDNDNVIVLKTLKKESYIRNYFDEYLSNLDNYDYYQCNNGKSYYYNENSKIVIKKIDIKRKLLLKTITINYAKSNLEELCN